MHTILDKTLYFFDEPPAGDAAARRAILGGKGAGLAEMTAEMGLPVPYGFTLPTHLGATLDGGAWPAGLETEVDQAVARVEARLGRRFGDAADPLFLSVRSGAAQSMPGMMDTILNVGATPATIATLAQRSSQAFATQCYARFLTMFGKTVLDIPEAAVEAAQGDVARLRETLGQAIPLAELDDPAQQLRRAIVAVYRSWNSDRAQLYRQRQGIEGGGTAATVQAMVFGNRDDRSGTGVYFTRDPNTGEKAAYGDYLARAQGEDVVAGSHQTDPISVLARTAPDIWRQLAGFGEALERRYRDMCDIEFTIESGQLWMLQVRPAKRSAAAAIQVALDLRDEQLISPREAVQRLAPDILSAAEDALAQVSGGGAIADGLGASPGVASGRVYFTADAAADAADRGEAVIFCAQATSPADLHGFEAAKGILTTTGGLVSHASLVAREWGIPAVVGAASVVLAADSLTAGGVTVREGEVITVDGSAGKVFAGAVAADAGTGAEPTLFQRLRALCAGLVDAADGEPLSQLVARARAAA